MYLLTYLVPWRCSCSVADLCYVPVDVILNAPSVFCSPLFTITVARKQKLIGWYMLFSHYMIFVLIRAK